MSIQKNYIQGTENIYHNQGVVFKNTIVLFDIIINKVKHHDQLWTITLCILYSQLHQLS